MTHQYVFDYHDGDIYWCTADVGWVTGHRYIVYGPLANGATTLMFEGVPNYPDHSRFWQVVDKHEVNIFYTAPTAIRALMGAGDEHVTTREPEIAAAARLASASRSTRKPGSGITASSARSRCPIVDTWWQTETGGILITPLPGATKLKPGSATLPFFGVQPAVVDAEGNVLEGATSGQSRHPRCLARRWRTVYGDHKRFVDTYFSTYKGKYFTGDGCRRDEDGYYWITGRVDDVINVSGHRMGTAEVELRAGRPPQGRGGGRGRLSARHQGPGHLLLRDADGRTRPGRRCSRELRDWVRKEIGPIASPDLIQFAPGLPKTRSGKIMRRILRKIAEDDFANLGDISTLADPAVVEDLIDNRQNKSSA